jgi:uncharacterized protein YidB (DUF937 family)
MLEQIAALVKQFGQDSVVNNPDIANDVNDEVLADATHTISGGMQNMLAGGGLQDIISMFTGGGSQTNAAKSGGIGGLLKNPIVMMMVGHFVSKLISKYKMSPEKANSVSSALIPNVLTDLVSRTKDTNPENDSFDLNNLIGSLTGGNVPTAEAGGFDFQNLIKQFTGGGNDSNSGNGGGGFDLQDIISKVTSGAQQNQAQQSGGGGGLFDLIKGFISK